MQRAKQKFSNNPGPNIWELYNVLAQVGFDTSKTKLDTQYNEPGVRVVSRVTKRFKTQEIKK